MSADNWAICPRCCAKVSEELSNAEKNLRDLYGKVTLEEYELVRKQVDKCKADLSAYEEKDDHSLREDYEMVFDTVNFC